MYLARISFDGMLGACYNGLSQFPSGREMSKIAQVVTTISDATKVPRAKVDYIARRLGEAGMLPRGPRGRHAPDFTTSDIVRVILGVMVLTTDAETPASKMPTVVKAILTLETGAHTFEPDGHEIVGRLRKDIFIHHSNLSFAEAFAAFLCETAPNNTEKERLSLVAAGISFTSGLVSGWMNLKWKNGDISHVRYVQEKEFLDAIGTGLVREAWISAKVMRQISTLLDDDANG